MTRPQTRVFFRGHGLHDLGNVIDSFIGERDRGLDRSYLDRDFDSSTVFLLGTFRSLPVIEKKLINSCLDDSLESMI